MQVNAIQENACRFDTAKQEAGGHAGSLDEEVDYVYPLDLRLGGDARQLFFKAIP